MFVTSHILLDPHIHFTPIFIYNKIQSNGDVLNTPLMGGKLQLTSLQFLLVQLNSSVFQQRVVFIAVYAKYLPQRPLQAKQRRVFLYKYISNLGGVLCILNYCLINRKSILHCLAEHAAIFFLDARFTFLLLDGATGNLLTMDNRATKLSVK